MAKRAIRVARDCKVSRSLPTAVLIDSDAAVISETAMPTERDEYLSEDENEDALDKALADTFPASDPVAFQTCLIPGAPRTGQSNKRADGDTDGK